MIAASYGGGFGISLPVGDDGVGEVVSRDHQPNMHACVFGPDGQTAYFVSLGADLIVQCALDGHTLVPLTRRPCPHRRARDPGTSCSPATAPTSTR